MRVNSPVVFSIKLEQKYVRACSTRNLTGLSADPCTPETLRVSICVYEQAPTAPIACRYELFFARFVLDFSFVRESLDMRLRWK